MLQEFGEKVKCDKERFMDRKCMQFVDKYVARCVILHDTNEKLIQTIVNRRLYSRKFHGIVLYH